MIDTDEIYDKLEDLGIKYSAHEVSQAVEGINWKINKEDIPLCVAGLLLNKVQLTNIQLITYDEGEFTEWLENDQTKFDGGYQVIDHTGTTRYFGWNYGGGRIKELFIQKKVIFTTKAPVTESKKPAKKNLKEDVGGCFYIIHERPIGYKGYQGWIDEYSELTSDIDSAEHYETLQEAVDMLYAIEDYVENFNDGEGIRAAIQCVNPDADQVVEDVAVVDIQKRWGVVDCKPVSGKQNLINCGYWVEGSEFYREGKNMDKPTLREAQERVALIAGKKKLNEQFSSVEEENDAVENFCILMDWEVEPEDVLHCVKNSDGNFTMQLNDGTQFTYDPVNDCLVD